MFEIFIYGVFLFTSTFCVIDMYKTSYEDRAYAECSDTTYYFNDDNKLVFSTHHFNIKNNRQSREKFDIRYAICPINSSCITKRDTVIVDPYKEYSSNTWNLYTKYNQKTTGIYYYRVITDIKGYKTIHTENTCKVRIVHE